MRIRVSSTKIALFGYFLGIIVTGSLFLMLPVSWRGPEPLRYVDALFTATSAVCVTGLVSVDTASYTRFGQALIAILIQMGGLGIITFATVYIAAPRRRISLVSRSIIKDYYIDEVEYKPKEMVRHIAVTTFSIELIGAALLFLRFRELPDGLFIAIFHAISAFCNAGFSTFGSSLEAYVADPAVNLVIMFLIILGGIGFLVLRDVALRVRGKKRRLSCHSRLAIGLSAALIALGAIAFLALERDRAMRGLPAGAKVLASLFQSVTARTAGFDTIVQSTFSSPSILVTMMLMFIGACPGSTGGGVKTTTFYVALRAVFASEDPGEQLLVGSRSIPAATVRRAFGVIGKGLAIVLTGLALLLLAQAGAGAPVTMTQALFEVLSAFGTVGLSLGITPALCDPAKAVIILTMFAGRIGLFAMALPRSSRRIERYADLPGTDLLIG